ncbi:MAG TPA: sulfotransferase [Pseudomonadales bacterium]|nr:sulfotransferase [Pseudomonadales bacterium]
MNVAIPEAGLTGDNLLFIVGCPRSGTTWLQRLLASHDLIKTGQESRIFEYIGSQFRNWQQDINSPVYGRGGMGLACYLNEEEFVSIQKKYLSLLLGPMLQDLQPGQIFLEKTPEHAQFVPEIVRLLPEAKIIHMVRDPRDVTASLLAASASWGNRWAPRRASQAIRLWWLNVNRVELAALHVAPGKFLEVRYEDLHRDPSSILADIARFLKLPWTDLEIATVVKANSAEELRMGKGTPIPIHGEHGKHGQQTVLDPENFVRKAQVGSWRRDLTWFQRLRVWQELRKIGPRWKRYANKLS